MNPCAESWVATIRRECLDHFFILGKVHLEYLIKEFVHYYNTLRPHSAMNNEPLTPADYPPDGEIRDQPILGGLHHHYYRA
ncbi:MAG: transposase [Candidatus Omnitrophica bacterium]|nr:transposase [Candidatus Omnitrophota bacterium]